MEKSHSKATFTAAQDKDGRRGWHVHVTFPHAVPTDIGGFNSRREAEAWIKHESAAWLKNFDGGKDA